MKILKATIFSATAFGLLAALGGCFGHFTHIT